MTLTRSPTSIRVMKHIAMSGLGSRRALLSLPLSERTLYHKLTQLRSEKYISKAIYIGENVYALSQKGKDSLCDPNITGADSELFSEFFKSHSMLINTQDTGRCVRQKRQSEILSVLDTAKIPCILGDKPLLIPLAKTNEDNIPLNTLSNFYYTSVELRTAVGITSRFAASARVYGVLANESGVYAVYHTGSAPLSTTFNKEVLAFGEYCSILSKNGYTPSPHSRYVDWQPPDLLKDVELLNRTNADSDEDGDDEESLAELASGYGEDMDEYERDEYGYVIMPDEDSEASVAVENSAQPTDTEPAKLGIANDNSEANGEARLNSRQRAEALNITAEKSVDVQYSSNKTQDKLAEWLGRYSIDTIIFADGYDAAKEMIDKVRQKHSVLKPAPNTFGSMVYIPIDEHSAYHLRLVTTPKWRSIMHRIIFKTKPEEDEYSGCDGKVGDELWYNFCDLDLVRIRELLDYLENMQYARRVPKIVIWAQSHHEQFLRSLFDKYGDCVRYRLTQAEKLITAVDRIRASTK